MRSATDGETAGCPSRSPSRAARTAQPITAGRDSSPETAQPTAAATAQAPEIAAAVLWVGRHSSRTWSTSAGRSFISQIMPSGATFIAAPLVAPAFPASAMSAPRAILSSAARVLGPITCRPFPSSRSDQARKASTNRAGSTPPRFSISISETISVVSVSSVTSPARKPREMALSGCPGRSSRISPNRSRICSRVKNSEGMPMASP